MRRPLRLRRYLVHFSSYNIPQIFTDVLVIGSGIAGLSAVCGLPEDVSVLLVTKGGLREGSTGEAQGGVAAALGPSDSPGDHFVDTVEAGGGLCNEEAVRVVTEEGPARVRELMDMGVSFDREDGGFSFTLEGGHHRPRILHANGDATGLAIEETLAARAR
jgi:L-aspartate oxidase